MRRPKVLVVATVLCLGLAALAHPSGSARGAVLNSRPVGSNGANAVVVSTPPLQAPHALRPFHSPAKAGEGEWRRAGRLVDGRPAVYTTTVRLPDNPAVVAGIAWMDTKRLRARLYSGSLSPGGLSWKFTAPILPAAATTLVAAFAGGFLLNVSQGGYLSEGHLVAPLRRGAASLVIYKNGVATVGMWGRDVFKTPAVVAVRQNLNLLVDHGHPVPGLNPDDISAWGKSLNNVVNTWRSGLGLSANGALVYVSGPMNIVDLADLLVRAGAIRAMVLDMNPLWPIFATYAPASANGAASPANGRDLLPTMLQSPARFFEPTYSRDFITMSAL